MSGKPEKQYFPLFVDLSDRRVLVVGAGNIAGRRIRALADFTEHLTVIAPEVNPEIRRMADSGKICLLQKQYENGDLDGADLVIAATGDHLVNDEIYRVCRERRIPVNVCSDREKCDFYFPGLAVGDGVVVGVTANGTDHCKARKVTEEIREMLNQRGTADPVDLGNPGNQSVQREPMDPGDQMVQRDPVDSGDQVVQRDPMDLRGQGDQEDRNVQRAPGDKSLRKDQERMFVRLYTDGAARGNPDGPGGYGTVLQYVDSKGQLHEKELSQGYVKTTNNRMELMAAIVGLEALNRPCQVELYSDSRYLTDAFNLHWIEGWIKKGWKRGKNESVKNPDLWKRLLKAMEPHEVTFRWVKGHNGHDLNERCDKLATTAADGEDLMEDVPEETE